MVQLALLSFIGLSAQPPAPDVDVWFCPRIEVTGYTPLDQSPSPAAYDIRDAFGGTYGNVSHEGGHIVFEDNTGGAGHPDFIDWNTKFPVLINRMVFTYQDDSPGKNWRNLSHFWIYARRFGDENWKIIWQDNTPEQVGRYTISKIIPAEQFQYFRAEFIRGASTDGGAVAPRICALEAYGHEVRP